MKTGESGLRPFFRDYPFQGPYSDAARSYKEAALKAACFVHKPGAVQYWKNHDEPDISFQNNTYACKIIGATIRIECFIARQLPSERDGAMAVACNAADCIIRIFQAADTPPAYIRLPIIKNRTTKVVGLIMFTKSTK